MVLVQNFEMPLYKGGGIFLNPYTGGTIKHPYYKHYRMSTGHGLGDIFSSALGFLKNNSGLISDAASAAASVANIAKIVKDIKNNDEITHEIKRKLNEKV